MPQSYFTVPRAALVAAVVTVVSSVIAFSTRSREQEGVLIQTDMFPVRGIVFCDESVVAVGGGAARHSDGAVALCSTASRRVIDSQQVQGHAIGRMAYTDGVLFGAVVNLEMQPAKILSWRIEHSSLNQIGSRSVDSPAIHSLAVDRELGLMAEGYALGGIAIRRLDGALVCNLDADGQTISAMRFISHNRSIVVTGDYGRVSVWDIDRARVEHQAECGGDFSCCELTQDGKKLVLGGMSGDSGLIVTLDTVTWEIIERSSVASGKVLDLSLDPRGSHLVAACENGTGGCVIAFRVTTLKPQYEPLEFSSVARAVEFSPRGGRIVTGHEDGVIRIWRRSQVVNSTVDGR